MRLKGKGIARNEERVTKINTGYLSKKLGNSFLSGKKLFLWRYMLYTTNYLFLPFLMILLSFLNRSHKYGLSYHVFTFCLHIQLFLQGACLPFLSLVLLSRYIRKVWKLEIAWFTQYAKSFLATSLFMLRLQLRRNSTFRQIWI